LVIVDGVLLTGYCPKGILGTDTIAVAAKHDMHQGGDDDPPASVMHTNKIDCAPALHALGDAP
jgi:hypothetical protein